MMPYLAATSCASRSCQPGCQADWEAPAVAAASAAFWMLVADCTSFPISIARATKPNVAVSATVQRTRMTPSSRFRPMTCPPDKPAKQAPESHQLTTVSGIPLPQTLLTPELFASPLYDAYHQ